jgi:flagellin
MTNPSAMTALQSLRQTNKALDVTQSRISTGFRVAEAKDNAAYWSIATTMRSDNKALSTVQDSLGLGASRIDTAYTAMNKSIELVDEIKQKVLAAIGASESDKQKIQTEIVAFQAQLTFVANAATFSGTNWLSVDSSTANGHAVAGTHSEAQIVSAFNRSSDGDVTIGTINIDVQQIKLYDAAATTNTTRGILEGLRLGTSGMRDDAALDGVAGTIDTEDGSTSWASATTSFSRC